MTRAVFLLLAVAVSCLAGEAIPAATAADWFASATAAMAGNSASAAALAEPGGVPWTTVGLSLLGGVAAFAPKLFPVLQPVVDLIWGLFSHRQAAVADRAQVAALDALRRVAVLAPDAVRRTLASLPPATAEALHTLITSKV